MRDERRTPQDVARTLAERSRREGRGRSAGSDFGWRRETFTLPREAARAKAREWFDAFPAAAYMTAVESWRELADDRIEFTMRRLPSAD